MVLVNEARLVVAPPMSDEATPLREVAADTTDETYEEISLVTDEMVEVGSSTTEVTCPAADKTAD